MTHFVSPFSISSYQELDPALKKIEVAFNEWGYYPVISTGSGMLRQFYGVVELIIAVATATFNLLRVLFISPSERIQKIEIINESLFILHNYARHGIANLVRGHVESIILLNLIYIFYDQSEKLRLRYEYEDKIPQPSVFAPFYPIQIKAR